MTKYKQLTQELQDRVKELEQQVQEMTNLDGMCAALSNDDAKQVLTTFADRARNRAELMLLIRAITQL